MEVRSFFFFRYKIKMLAISLEHACNEFLPLLPEDRRRLEKNPAHCLSLDFTSDASNMRRHVNLL